MNKEERELLDKIESWCHWMRFNTNLKVFSLHSGHLRVETPPIIKVLVPQKVDAFNQKDFIKWCVDTFTQEEYDKWYKKVNEEAEKW